MIVIYTNLLYTSFASSHEREGDMMSDDSMTTEIKCSATKSLQILLLAQ